MCSGSEIIKSTNRVQGAIDTWGIGCSGYNNDTGKNAFFYCHFTSKGGKIASHCLTTLETLLQSDIFQFSVEKTGRELYFLILVKPDEVQTSIFAPLGEHTSVRAFSFRVVTLAAMCNVSIS